MPIYGVRDLCGFLELFDKRKVALSSVAEALDTGSAAGRLVITIMGAVSQWEREAIGERTRDALRHKRSNGERVGNIEFGYRLSQDRRHLEPDPTEQAALAEIRGLGNKGPPFGGKRTRTTGGGARPRARRGARICRPGRGKKNHNKKTQKKKNQPTKMDFLQKKYDKEKISLCGGGTK